MEEYSNIANRLISEYNMNVQIFEKQREEFISRMNEVSKNTFDIQLNPKMQSIDIYNPNLMYCKSREDCREIRMKIKCVRIEEVKSLIYIVRKNKEIKSNFYNIPNHHCICIYETEARWDTDFVCINKKSDSEYIISDDTNYRTYKYEISRENLLYVLNKILTTLLL